MTPTTTDRDPDPNPGGAALRPCLTDDPLYTERRYPIAYVDPETRRERAGGTKTTYYAQRRLYEFVSLTRPVARPVPAKAEALLSRDLYATAEERRAAQLAWAELDRLARRRVRGSAA